jgi:phosphate transport system protein
MKERQTSPHTVREYDAELNRLRDKVVSMGTLAEHQLTTAIEALANMNIDLGTKVIAQDETINNMQVEIDGMCTWLIAHRQPTAADLRLVLTAIKITTDLERVADQAKNIARATSLLSEARDKGNPIDCIGAQHVGQYITGLLHSAVDRFSRSQTMAAETFLHASNKIRHMCDSNTRKIISHIMEEPDAAAYAMGWLSAGDALERAGILTINISEQIHSLLSVTASHEASE